MRGNKRVFIEHVFFLFGRQPIIVIFWQNYARTSVNLIPKLVKVTLRVHYESLDCVKP